MHKEAVITWMTALFILCVYLFFYHFNSGPEAS